uniref:Apple domain-containing protein n=1 Tax=Trichuris muris TaxID=70415 RepID=A0A5S6QF90_TRIMR
MPAFCTAATYVILFFALKVGAEVRCIEEQSNNVVVGITPVHIFSAEAPHICVMACIKAKGPTCSLSAFTRRNDQENGTCFLYGENVGKFTVKPRSSKAAKSEGAIHSIYKVLQRCPKVDKNISAIAKKYIKMGGRKVLNIEGRKGWGMPVEIHVDDWGPWSEWSSCVEPIPIAEEITVHNRVRICGACGVNRIIEFETNPCDCCPEWLPWGPWGPCSASCGPGVSVRSRLCTIPGGCPGPSDDVHPCSLAPCASWTIWGPWGPCVGACGVGHRERVRHCEGVGTCVGPATETMACSEIPPCCSQWSSFGPCSVTCGRGIQMRFRRCEPVGHPMTPHLEESVPCDLGPCGHWVPCMTWVEETGPVIDHECMARRNQK